MRKLRLLGVLFIVGSIGFSACTNCKEEATTNTDTLKEVVEAEVVLSERDKKIVNREELTFQDAENPTDFELKHTPQIDILEKDEKGLTEVRISVGQNGIVHPTTNDHWIDFLKLYADDNLIASIEYESGLVGGFATFKVNLSEVKNLKAQIGCNIHGIWEFTWVCS